jgi:large subunit ribosomal protein L23
MKFLDRFKKQKEQELESGIAPKESEEKQVKDRAVKKDKKTEKPEEKKVDKKAVKESASRKKPTVARSAKEVRVELTKVIIAPVITEKATYLASRNQYVFRVVPRATRIEVRTAFKELYGVLPKKVNIIKMRGEPVRFGRVRGKQKAWKKAIISVPKGKDIQVYEGV